MSDSTTDLRRRGRRGSLLDHASDASPAAQASVREPNGEAVPASEQPVHPARISTARLAQSRNPAPKPPAESLLASAPTERAASAPADHAAPAAAAALPSMDPVKLVSSDREKFGDRITRLIGTITPDEQPAEPQPAAEQPEPARPAEAQYPRSHPETSARHPGERDHPFFPQDSPRDDHHHWHPAPSRGGFDDEPRPLLYASILISAVWRYRYLIGAVSVAGAVMGVAVALSTPHEYHAESRLFVDPREIRVTEDDIRNQQLSTEAMLAIADSQLQILSSTSVLEKVIVDLGLERDPEFNGSMSSGGISGGLSLIKELITGKSGVSEVEQRVLNHLRDAVSVDRDAKTFVIIVGVDTRDPDKSALIANQIVETYLDAEGQAQSSLLERTSESIDTRINSLRADLDTAEREVERFKAENGLVGVGGQYIDDKVILALSDQLANARAMKVGIRVKADILAKVKIGDVLSGAFPEELLSSNLTELRKQYTQTKSNAESLATSLGPRHPQYIAAMSLLDTITREISAELRRIVASSQAELQRAVATEQEMASQMAVAKSRAMDQSVELVTLRELEREATATRGIYEAFLTRSRETSERSNLSTRNVRVISPAETPLDAMGPSRKIIAIGGIAAGLFAGLGLALLVGAVESIRAYNGAQPQARFQNPPYAGYPEPPEPGPRTPPNGPGHRLWPRRNEDATGFDTAADEATAPAFSGPRVQSEADSAEPIRAQSEVAQSTGLETARGQQSAAPSDYEAPQPEPSPSTPYLQTPAAHPGSETAPNAQAFMTVHGQPHQHVPAQAPLSAPVDGQDPCTGQPLWTAYPAQPQPLAQTRHQPQYQPLPPQPEYRPQPQYQPPQQHPQPAHPIHPRYAPEACAPVQPGYTPGYSAAPAGPAAVAPAYPMPQPTMMPVQSHPQFQPQFQPQAYPVHQPVAQPQMPAAQHYAASHPMPFAQPTPAPLAVVAQPPMAAPLQVWPQIAQQAVAPPYPVAAPEALSAVQPVQSTEPEQPVRTAGNEAVDRIRREMDVLRTRIDGYGSERRRA